jgi:hypothetical protein
MAMGGPIPVVNAARAAWLYTAFLPICVAATFMARAVSAL